MKTFAKGLMLAASLATMAGCSDSTGVAVTDLAGSWSATTFLLTSVATPATTFEGIGAGGNVTLVIDHDGAFQIVTTPPGGGVDEVISGTLTTHGKNGITLNFVGGETDIGTVTVSSGTMTLNLTSGVTWDFGGGDESAHLHAVFSPAT